MEQRQQQILDLLDRRGPDLHRLLARLTRCEETTRDLMQELFLRLCTARGFEKADNPYAYAWKTAANLAFRWHRRQKSSFRSLDAVYLSGAAPDDSLAKLIEAEQLRRVLRVTATLKELPRNVIVMRYIEQKSYEEISEHLGKHPDYIRALCSKTLRRLRDKLGVRSADPAGREVCCE